MTDSQTDAQYYQVARPHTLSERVVIAARDRMYALFMSRCTPAKESTIADVGVSDVVTDAANLLERLYPYPDHITALGLGDGVDFRAAYPQVAYTQIKAGAAMPFPADHFDIATANAVLEHVGSIDAQKAFIAELTRIARSVFITVPHRYFPVEHHTGLPFVHYSDRLFAITCRLTGKSEWANESNLIFMTKKRLHALVPIGMKAEIGYTGIPLGPLSSNLYLRITK
jgi:hypothetical protein